jgi:hypothetical protein
MNTEHAKRSRRWLAVAAIVLFGILNFVNQGMPFWFNVVFIVGCLIVLWLLPKAEKRASPEESGTGR